MKQAAEWTRQERESLVNKFVHMKISMADIERIHAITRTTFNAWLEQYADTPIANTKRAMRLQNGY